MVKKKKPITATLLAMEIGGTEVFPIIQRDSVASTIARQRFKTPAKKWNFSTDMANKSVSVTRIK